MTLLKDASEAKKSDIRLIDRNFKKGLISQDEIQRLAGQLPDDAANAEWVSVETLSDDESDLND